jgi:hypothetical protein
MQSLYCQYLKRRIQENPWLYKQKRKDQHHKDHHHFEGEDEKEVIEDSYFFTVFLYVFLCREKI